MKIIIAMSLLLLGAKASAQKCDCYIYPISPECKEECGIKLLQTGTKEQLKNELKLDENTANAIVKVSNRKRKNSIEAFQDDLTVSTYKVLSSYYHKWIASGNQVIIQQNVNGDNVGHDQIKQRQR